ncbi:MAG: exodeoxyribonuclease III [Pseudomonadota bacterium]|nr:exodeoxyribonuclease III [Pseudomonadota bacterium]
MKITTWNINSVRLRLPLVLDKLAELDTDVLCLQETKTQDEHFPHAAIAEAGWPHIAIRGEKSYNGVAILSRLPLEDISHMNWTGRTDTRHISASVGGLTIHNFYIPAGGDEPDRDKNPKFGHKLDFLAEMTDYFTGQQPRNAVLVGDLNIAPLAADVWSTRQLKNVVSHTDIERKALLALIEEGGWTDAVRANFGPDEVLYSWWSYRARDWAASDRGRRLDHIWVSADIADKVKTVTIDRAARGADKPSDHVPVSATFLR